MNVLSIFLNQLGNLRSGWRFAVFLFAFLLFGTIFGGAGMALFFMLPHGQTEGTALFWLVSSLLSLISALVVGWLCGKYLERLPFRALGAWFTKGWLKHLVFGLLLGAASIVLAVLLGIVFGGLSFQINHSVEAGAIISTLFISLLVFAAAAAFEEALFRGYVFQTFTRAGLAWLAIALTAVLFGWVHTRNPNAGLISTANTALSGIWFGIAYLKTRDLWFPFGVHLMWNWMQGSVFGIEVSGLTEIVNSPLLKEVDSGPSWLTGETYGVEGGIVTTIALIVSTVVIYFLPFVKPDEEMLKLSEPPA